MNEKDYLRRLAGRYADIAKSDIMDARREKWRLHNRMEASTVPFHIEDNGTYLQDLTPPLQCTDEQNRALERQLLRAITRFETINDDRIIPERFLVGWVRHIGSYCDELEITRADNGKGSNLGYETNKPIKDIHADWDKLKRRTATLDQESTERNLALAQAVFAGLLRVEVGLAGSMYSNGITNKAVHLMGMQELFLQMAMDPEAVHRLFGALAEDNLALGQWEEDQGLLTRNNDGNQSYCSGSCYYGDEVPERDIPPGEPVRTTDMFGYLESQESQGISPGMFEEFLMPHFRKLAANFQLIKFGCCEAVHPFMPSLRKLHGLRKVTVSPWCDLKVLARECPTNVIWSRKPTPLKLCGDTFSPEAMRAHLQETLDVGEGFFVEFVFRDTNRLTGAMQDRVAQTCDIVRELAGKAVGV